MLNIKLVADDFGYCKQRNRGVIELCQKGLIHKISLLVNANECHDAVSTYNALPANVRLNVKVGLHLNLTEGEPVTEKVHVPSLLSESGHFLGKIGLRNKLDRVSESEVRQEIVSQIERFKDLLGYLPTYVDGHQHIHICRKVRHLFADVLSAYGIRKTRVPFELEIRNCDWLREPQISFLETVCEDSKLAQKVFSKHGLKYSDFFVGLSTMGKNMTRENVRRVFENIMKAANNERQKGLAGHSNIPLDVEFMVHPGYRSQVGLGGFGLGPDEFSMSDERELELVFLRDEFKSVVTRFDSKLS